ncbi:MAG TPA: hypothetical protein VFA07_14955 [Chthonomonadaceae bacterium]|nr:hypothetical protein [Chthonomonadaceae bacterium]
MSAQRVRSHESQNREQQLENLILEAQKQPGLTEVMAVFRDWQRLDQEAEPVRLAMEVPPAVITSTSSAS